MTDDHHMFETLREAADPRLPPGASSRIADGAWARAASAPRRGVSRFLGGPRVLWAAAAAVLVAVSVLALRGTDPAFAVEGDPVMVARGDGWAPEHKVRLDDVVRVPDEGSRLLRSRDGGVLTPLPGSQFRFVRSDGEPRAIRIEFECGGGEFDGTSFVVAARDMVVEREPSAAGLRFSIAIGADDGGARVAVDRGRAVVWSLATSERLLLHPAERAAALRVSLAGKPCVRLARVADWTPAVDSQIASGVFSVFDAARGPVDGITLVGTTGTREFFAFDVPPADVQAAVRRVNMFALLRVACRADAPGADAGTRYVYELGARRVELTTRHDGVVTVTDGGAPRVFRDLAEFRRDAPELAALFGDTLPR